MVCVFSFIYSTKGQVETIMGEMYGKYKTAKGELTYFKIIETTLKSVSPHEGGNKKKNSCVAKCLEILPPKWKSLLSTTYR